MNWRDYTSLLAISLVSVAAVAVLLGVPIVHQMNLTWASVLLTLLGLLIFGILSPLFAPTSKPESISVALLGMLALILAFTSAVLNNKVIFIIFCVNLIILWTLSTVYHIQEHEARHLHQ